MEALVFFLTQSVRYAVPLLFGTTGEILTEKAGSLNLGVEGTMAVGAIGGCLIGIWADSLAVGVIAAFLCAALCGLIFSFLTVSLQANQNVTGLAMTIFGVGVYQFIGQSLQKKGTFPMVGERLYAQIRSGGIPLLKDIPVLGELLFSYNSLVYFGIIVAIVCWFYLRKTKTGLRVRAIGENPGAADGVGVNITASKYLNIIVGSGICGIGGLYMALMINSGVYNDGWINGFGWIAIALVIFANWSPAKALGGSFVFGLLNSLQANVGSIVSVWPQGLSWMAAIPTDFYQMLPFVITAIILIISSITKSKNSASPAALGVNYYREER